MLSVKEVFKKHFLRFWYDSTWDWILVSCAIDEDSNHQVFIEDFNENNIMILILLEKVQSSKYILLIKYIAQ